MGRIPVVLRTLSSLCSIYLDLEMSRTWDWTINEEMAQTSTTLLPACALSSPYPNLLLALLLQHSIFQCPDYDPELHQFTQPPRTTTQFHAQQLDSHLKAQILSLQEDKINEDINTQMCCCGLNFLLSLQNPVCEKTQFLVERESLFMLQPELWCQRL